MHQNGNFILNHVFYMIWIIYIAISLKLSPIWTWKEMEKEFNERKMGERQQEKKYSDHETEEILACSFSSIVIFCINLFKFK